MVARGSPTIGIRLSVKTSNSGDRFSVKASFAWTAIVTPAEVVVGAPTAAPTEKPRATIVTFGKIAFKVGGGGALAP